jgi:hypothetical protein
MIHTMPVDMERRNKEDPAPYRAQQLTLARRQLNKKRATEPEYMEAKEQVKLVRKLPRRPLPPFSMKRSNSDDLFADNVCLSLSGIVSADMLL